MKRFLIVPVIALLTSAVCIKDQPEKPLKRVYDHKYSVIPKVDTDSNLYKTAELDQCLADLNSKTP